MVLLSGLLLNVMLMGMTIEFIEIFLDFFKKLVYSVL